MKNQKLLSLLLAGALAAGLYAGFGGQAMAESASETLAVSESEATGEEIAITLSDAGSVCDSSAVEISGSTVTITAEGDYVLTGSLSDGQIVVNAPEDAKVKLILNGVTIQNASHAVIYALSADKLVVRSAADSENDLQSAGEFVQVDENNVDAAIFSLCDLTLSGEGVLNISSLSGHAVYTQDDLKVKGGTINLEAAGKGLYGNDSVTIEDGTVNADVGTDGVYADNENDGSITVTGGVLNLLCQKDGLDATGDILVEDGVVSISAGSGQEGKGVKSDASITVTGGVLNVTSVDDAVHASANVTITGGVLALSSGDDGIHADATVSVSGGSVTVSQSYEGIEGQVIDISGGEIAVSARDDGFNAAGGNDGSNSYGFFGGDPFDTDADASLTISGGVVYVNADGDGLDSNGTLNISGGVIYVSGPTNSGNGSLDYGLDATITGGTVIAVGASGMAENFGQNSTQGSILLNLSSTQAAGSTVTITDADGTVLASFQPEKSYSSVVISAPALVQGGTYTVTAGTETQTVTLTGLIYGSGMGMGGFGGGQMGGGFGRGQRGGFGDQGGQMNDSFGQGQMNGGFGRGQMGGGPMGGFGRP